MNERSFASAGVLVCALFLLLGCQHRAIEVPAGAAGTQGSTSSSETYPDLVDAAAQLESVLQGNRAKFPHYAQQTPELLFTKCDVGLGPQDCNPSENFKIISQQGYCERFWSGKGRDGGLRTLKDLVFSGMEPPVQHLKPHRVRESTLSSPSPTNATEPQFDSVLYNPQAACTIRRLGKDRASIQHALMDLVSSGQTAILTPIDGAKVLKLIWEPVAPPITSPGQSLQVPVMVSDQLWVKRKGVDLFSPLVPEIPLTGGNLPSSTQWRTASVIRTGSGCKVSFAGQPCIPAPYFDLTDQDLTRLDHLIDESGASEVETPVSHPTALVLVGINMIEFDHIRFPDWRWSAFWLDGESVGQPLFQEREWSHFAGCTITKPRTGPAVPGNTCMNPYLEGISGVNGAVSNCLSCHASAGIPAKPGKEMTGFETVALNAVELDIDGNPPAPVPDISPIPVAVRTHNLWSLADVFLTEDSSPQSPRR